MTDNGFSSVDEIPLLLLTEVLKNQVIAGGLNSADLSTGYYNTLAKGSASTTNTLSMFINLNSGVVINRGP